MNGISKDEVRDVVREENKDLSSNMARMIDSMEKMAGAIGELTAQSKANDEKFNRVHERIDEIGTLASNSNNQVVDILSNRLPEIEATVAVNSFSSDKVWRFALVVAVPLVGGMWAVFERLNSAQLEQAKLIATALKSIATTSGPGG